MALWEDYLGMESQPVVAESPRTAFVAILPTIVKARTTNSGKRIVEVCASVELSDLEGDCILQKALFDAAPEFLATGHIDYEHWSELGQQLGIPEPLNYILGRPTEVYDGGAGQTMVICQIKSSPDGISNPSRNSYDAFWEALTSEPPVLFRASVYGFLDPASTIDCREETCGGGWKGEGPAPTRFIVSKFDWRSLAFTRNPVCNGIKSYARVVSAKAWVGEVLAKGFVGSLPGSAYPKGLGFPDPGRALQALPGPALPVGAVEKQPEFGETTEEEREAFARLEAQRAEEAGDEAAKGMMPPASRVRPSIPTIDGEIQGGACPTCGGLLDASSIPMWKNHFRRCMGFSPDESELMANAAMYRSMLHHGWGKRGPRKRPEEKAHPEAPSLDKRQPSAVTVYGPGNQSLSESWRRPAHMANTRP